MANNPPQQYQPWMTGSEAPWGPNADGMGGTLLKNAPQGGTRPTQYAPDNSSVPHGHHITANGVVMTPAHVKAMQQFLVNHGFQIAVDGVLGPETKSAAAAFRTHGGIGVAPSWNAQHGLDPSKTGLTPEARTQQTKLNTPPSPPAKVPARVPTSAGAPDPISALLASMLGQGGNVGQMLDPNAQGTAAAAPDQSAIQSLLAQIALDPKQEAQNQYDISSWYGLNPKDPNYALSVLGRLGQARAGDAGVASDAASNVSDIASALAGSIGGSANGGAGALAAAGANDAGMMNALGKANTDYADNMNPLLAAEARGMMMKDKAANSQALMDLQAKLAAARGQSTADSAAARAAAIAANNSLDQQRFSNKGNLLDIMAQMQAAGQKGAYTQAQIQEMLARANHYNQTPTKPATGSWLSATPNERSAYAKALSQYAVQPGMTRAKANQFAQTLARTYFPNGGIPNTADVIRSILTEAGL